MNVAGTMYEAGFIGVGNMGEAIVRGLAPALGRGTIALFDPHRERVEAVGAELGCAVLDSAEAVAASSEVVVVAVKPGVVLPLLEALRPAIGHRPIIVSVAAGVTLAAMHAAVAGAASVVRAMPNTPCLVGRGVTAIATHPGAAEGAAERARAILSAVGLVVEVAEERIDAITALSGSGPAYVFRFMEGLIAGATALGLDEDLARRLAIATVGGAAALAEGSAEPPDVLRARVTSPNGTTAAALASFDADGLIAIVEKAMAAAAARSGEMAVEICGPAGRP